MNSPETIHALNRLLQIHYRSLPMYLSHTRPWTHRGHDKVAQVLRQIVADQQAIIARITDLIIQEGGAPDLGSGRDDTTMNDLSLQYLVVPLADRQKQDIVSIDQCVASLSEASAAALLARETLGMAKGHLDSLEDVASIEA